MIKKEYEELIKIINHHNYLYHTLYKPEISDVDYDKLFDRLLQIEKEYPELLQIYSPSQRVGSEPLSKFEIVKHRVPMLSLQKVKNFEEFKKWDEKIKKELKEGR
jgi:DNA ligase (NAD+)